MIMKAARFAVYMARKMSANIAQMCAMNLAVCPLGQSTLTAAWNSTAHTNQRVLTRENRLCGWCSSWKAYSFSFAYGIYIF